MLMVFATSRATMKTRTSQIGKRCVRFPASPMPVTLPMRAHIICTAAISGQVSSAVQRSLVPSCAPATEYVAIPDGSSSAAPVITPGPIAFNSLRIQRYGEFIGKRGRAYVVYESLWNPSRYSKWSVPRADRRTATTEFSGRQRSPPAALQLFSN